MRINPSQEQLRSLRDKYERILALRRDHARAREDASFVEPDPRADMASLAEEFPGALRELDMLPLRVLAARLDALTTAERSPGRTEPWMLAQSLFHRYARGALVTKRWLGGKKRITEATREAFIAALPDLPRSADAALFVDALEDVASPPRGRVMDLVHARVALHLGVTATEVRALVFAPRRLLRRGGAG
jgi:hypothetical protein